MKKQKGQIQVVVLVLAVVLVLLFTGGFSKLKTGLSERKSASPEKKTTISTPSQVKPESKPEKTEEPAEVSPPAPDLTPPHRSNPQPKGSLPAETRKITMSLETNEIAVCKYETVSGVYYDSMQQTFSQTSSTTHSILITTLDEGKSYKYYVKCADEQGNKNSDDFIVSFSVKAPLDTTPPERSYFEPSGVLPAGTTETIIGVSTNEPASCRYSFEQGVDYNSMKKSLSADESKRRHTVRITKLEDGKVYEYFIRCKDSAGNKNTGDVMIRFSVGT